MDFFLRLPESEEPRFRAVQPMLPTPEQQALPGYLVDLLVSGLTVA